MYLTTMDPATVVLWLHVGLVAVFASAMIMAVFLAIAKAKDGFKIDTLWGGLGGGSGGLILSPALAFALVALVMAAAAVASLPPLSTKDLAAGEAADTKPLTTKVPAMPAAPPVADEIK